MPLQQANASDNIATTNTREQSSSSSFAITSCIVLSQVQFQYVSYKQHMYTTSHKTSTRSFCDNFGKCGPILMLLSFGLWDDLQKNNLPQICCHTYPALWNLNVKLHTFTTKLLYSIQKCEKNCFITSNIDQKCHILDHMSTWITACVQNVCHQQTHTEIDTGQCMTCCSIMCQILLHTTCNNVK